MALELGPQAAMVVLDPATRDILALVGGYGYRAGSFDRSQRAQRQPGSAFKPFIYAAAIDSQRYTAASVVNDSPEVYKLWKPQNYDKDNFRGPVRLRTALALSINTVAIKLLSDVGLGATRELAIHAGITSPLPDSLELSLALGANTVTPIELANAYATFAAGGQHGDTRLISALGAQAIPTPPLEQDIRAETAYIMVSLMKSVVESGTARAATTRLGSSCRGRRRARRVRPTAVETRGSSGSRPSYWLPCGSASTMARAWDTARPVVAPRCPCGSISWSRPWSAVRCATSASRQAWSWCKSIRPPAFCLRLAQRAATRSSSTAPHQRKPRCQSASRKIRIRCCSRRMNSHHDPATAAGGRGRRRGRSRGRIRFRIRFRPRFSNGG